MDSLLGLIKGVAPALATAVAGPLGGAAVGWIADKLGVEDSTVEGVTAALTGNPEMLQKMKELDLEYAKLANADRDSARNREIEIAKTDSAWITKNITSLLAIGVMTSAFILVSILFFVNIPDSQENIIIYALGFITSAGTQILSFYFGSSEGSKGKDKEIKDMLKGKL